MPDSATPVANDLLRATARTLDTILLDRGWGAQPTVLVHLAARADGDIDLGLKEVDGHPADILIGCVAPEEWHALGVSQLGWAYDLSKSTTRRRIRITTLVSRTGSEAAVLRHESGDEVTEIDEPSEGRMSDILRRCLDVATPPPRDEPPTAIVAAAWLQAVSDADRAPLGWRAVCSLHPAPPAGDPTVADLIDAARALTGDTTWEELRWETIEGRWTLPQMSTTLASWFDQGSFARAVVPDLDTLDAVAPRLTLDARVRLEEALGPLCGW